MRLFKSLSRGKNQWYFLPYQASKLLSLRTRRQKRLATQSLELLDFAVSLLFGLLWYVVDGDQETDPGPHCSP